MSTSPGENRFRVGQHREKWTTRFAFYFAAVGAAVGFGNVWRFPALSVQYGGGAFFIPFLMALFLIGLPILILEIGLGHFFQTGDVGVFGGFHRRLRGVGLASVSCSFMLTVYYSMLIAWVLNAFFDSWSDSAPWSNQEVNGTVAVDYFVNDIIGQKTVGDDDRPTRVVGANVGYSFLIWFIIFLGTGFGVKWTGRITYFTMGLPVILLFIFLGRSASLDGSSAGIKEYIGIWDVSVLTEQGDVWSTAVSQIFFSIGVTFGIMTAFGSYLPKNEPVFFNSCVIAFSDVLFSFISGFAVFAALGHLAHLSDIPVVDLGYETFGLVFGTWPVVLGTLPGGEHWVRLLFLDLVLLGIDSAFGLIEASITVVMDTSYFEKSPKWIASAVICTIAFLLSIIYATDAGLHFLDAVDFYINFVLLFVGFLETFSAGWVYGHENTISKCGAPAFFSYMIANFGSVFLACGIWFGTQSVWGGFVALFVWYLIGIAFTGLFLVLKMNESEGISWPDMLWELSFKNMFDLKDRIEPVVGWIPRIWCLLIKQFIPHVLLILFINLAQSKTDDGEPSFGGIYGLPTKPFQIIGILCFAFALFLFSVGLLIPSFYDVLAPPVGSVEPEEGWEKDVSNKSESVGYAEKDVAFEEEHQKVADSHA
jgi:solute carrier family 6 GABA transporter-like protein 1